MAQSEQSVVLTTTNTHLIGRLSMGCTDFAVWADQPWSDCIEFNGSNAGYSPNVINAGKGPVILAVRDDPPSQNLTDSVQLHPFNPAGVIDVDPEVVLSLGEPFNLDQ